jgi:hypothetical protein
MLNTSNTKTPTQTADERAEIVAKYAVKAEMARYRTDGPNGAAPDLEQRVREFIYWVTHNEFTDPENMLVCAEWSNLCEAAGVPMAMAGSEYQR